MRRTIVTPSRIRWLTLLALTTAAACSSSVGEPAQSSPLAGINGVDAVDSSGHGVSLPLSPQGSGSVRGTVVAPSAPGAGNDSLSTAARIPGVVIRIYPIVGDPNVAHPTLGALLATVTTGANGQFQTPVIDGSQGWHALTFTPPAGSAYQARMGAHPVLDRFGGYPVVGHASARAVARVP